MLTMFPACWLPPLAAGARKVRRVEGEGSVTVNSQPSCGWGGAARGTGRQEGAGHPFTLSPLCLSPCGSHRFPFFTLRMVWGTGDRTLVASLGLSVGSVDPFRGWASGSRL